MNYDKSLNAVRALIRVLPVISLTAKVGEYVYDRYMENRKLGKNILGFKIKVSKNKKK
jgi:hypothetical protein